MILSIIFGGLAMLAIVPIAHLLRLIDRERQRHTEQVLAIVHGVSAERREWERERSVLLTRIVDPPAGVAAALAASRPSEPEPSPLDVDFSR